MSRSRFERPMSQLTNDDSPIANRTSPIQMGAAMGGRTVTLTALVAAGAIAVAIGQGRQGGPPPAQLSIEQVKPGLYAILNPGANTLAVRVTSEGVILVDDMFQQNYEQILALIKSVTDQPVKYVISTHHHGDHTGGNAQFLKTAQIIGHKNARAA